MLRAIFALCAGLFAAMIVYTISAATAMNLWPPTGVELKDPAQVAAFVAALPTSARLTLMCGPVFGAFAGAGIAARLAAPSQRTLVASLIGALIAANTAFDWSHVGHPQAMLVSGVVLTLLAALAATLLVRKAWPEPGK
jgi:hypothetical protein